MSDVSAYGSIVLRINILHKLPAQLQKVAEP